MCFFLKACMQYDKKAKLSVRFFFANDKKLKSREQKKRQQQKPEIKMKQANQKMMMKFSLMRSKSHLKEVKNNQIKLPLIIHVEKAFKLPRNCFMS